MKKKSLYWIFLQMADMSILVPEGKAKPVDSGKNGFWNILLCKLNSPVLYWCLISMNRKQEQAAHTRG